MNLVKTLAATIVVAALVPAAAHASAERVTAGGVSATLTWDGPRSAAQDAALTIVRDGVAAYQRAIPGAVCDGCRLMGAEDVRLLDLDGDGEREVLVTSVTGERDCCTLMGVYDFRSASGAYGELTRDWLSTGFELDDLDADGVPELVSGDVRFEDRFSSHEGSFPPLAIFDYERPRGRARLTDVTAGFPAQLRRHAARARARLKRERRGNPDAGGFVAAYVADQYLLGHARIALRELDRQIARGILGPPPIARFYRRDLLALLRRYGYR